MNRISISCSQLVDKHLVPLPGSKSESNRALIINALCDVPGKVENLAIARDTDIMQALLANTTKVYNAQDAGTVMRFMTAYLAVTKQNVTITGTERMKKRPIGTLVIALRELGARIDFVEGDGYPPLRISSLSEQKANQLQIESNISSQYISALLMIAPKLPMGLTLKLIGEPVSTPYIDMTVAIMEHFAVKPFVNGNSYSIEPGNYIYKPFYVEADWSGASYWYAIFCLSDLTVLRIKGLKESSTQGDSVLRTLMLSFGVTTSFDNETAVLTKSAPNYPSEIDFIKCPDLAQTFAVLCAALGHKCTFKGLKTLKIKETNRVEALKTELNKLDGDFIEEDDSWTVIPIPATKFKDKGRVGFNTYEDHRMALAFSALAVKMDISFDDASVVNKSYPTFWHDMENIGFKIE